MNVLYLHNKCSDRRMKVPPFAEIIKERPTDQQTDKPTDQPTYRSQGHIKI